MSDKRFREEVENILRHMNRRLMNVEAGLRAADQRIDVLEGLIKAYEEKSARNVKEIIDAHTSIADLRGEFEKELKDFRRWAQLLEKNLSDFDDKKGM